MNENFENNNGNIIISYDRTKVSNRKLLFIISELTLLICLFFLFQKSLLHIAISFFILGTILFFVLWSLFVDKSNKKKEKQLSFHCLNDIVKKDIENIGANIKELDRKYIRIDHEKETERAVYVLLSNGEQLKYNIIDKAEYENKRVFEIETKYSIVK
ncbi:MAG: hypothetical protein QM654_16985 [Dysgonamonadaceae bacterium]